MEQDKGRRYTGPTFGLDKPPLVRWSILAAIVFVTCFFMLWIMSMI